MATGNYSATWLKNAALLEQNIGVVSGVDFHTCSSFAGLYERPSPFRYRKTDPVSSLLNEHRSNGKNFSRMMRFCRESLLLKWDELRFRVLRMSGAFRAIEELLPEQKFETSGRVPFFYSFSRKKLNGPYLKAGEQLALLNSASHLTRVKTVCEIGAGFGALADSVIALLRPEKYLIIDLPQTLDICFGYLSVQAGHQLASAPFSRGAWRDRQLVIGESQVCFIDATATNLEELKDVDLFLNSSSFAEMDREVLSRYLDSIDRNPGAILLSANPKRVEGSTVFDPDKFASEMQDWVLLARAEHRSHPSLRGIIITLHRVMKAKS